jgi:hypothetical protein
MLPKVKKGDYAEATHPTVGIQLKSMPRVQAHTLQQSVILMGYAHITQLKCHSNASTKRMSVWSVDGIYIFMTLFACFSVYDNIN